MTTTIRPTRQALRVHLSHLATTHRAPLVPRHRPSDGDAAQRTRPTAFTPMARDPFPGAASARPSQLHES
jgi:hypothetical protein